VSKASFRDLRPRFHSLRASFRGDCSLEPAAAICQPPTHHADRNRCDHCPPQWQAEIRDDAQDRENGPEDFPFHSKHSSPAIILSIKWTYDEVAVDIPPWLLRCVFIEGLMPENDPA